MVSLYSGTLSLDQLVIIQRWPAYTVEPVYSSHSWDTTSWLLQRWCIVVTLGSWLLYRGGLLIQWKLNIVLTHGIQPVGCYTEVVCSYSI